MMLEELNIKLNMVEIDIYLKLNSIKKINIDL